MPKKSLDVSRGDTFQFITDTAMKLFQLSTVTSTLMIGWFLWGIISGSLADVPNRTPQQQAETLQIIQNLSLWLEVSLGVNIVAGLILFYNESAYGVTLLLIAGFLAYGLQYSMDAMGSDSKALLRGAASTASLKQLHQCALIFAVPGIGVVVYSLATSIWSGGGNDLLTNVNYGKGTVEQQKPPTAMIGAFAACWQLSFCRESIRKNCPIYHARTKCWKQGVGCMCEANIIQVAMGADAKPAPAPEHMDRSQGFVALGDLISEDERKARAATPTRQGPRGVRIPYNPHVTPEQQKERCRNCIIYNEHQRQKYQFFAPLITLAVPGLAFWQFDTLKGVLAGLLSHVDTTVGKLTLQGSSGQTKFAQEVMGSLSVEVIMVVCVTLVVLTWALRFLEYCMFKAKI